MTANAFENGNASMTLNSSSKSNPSEEEITPTARPLRCLHYVAEIRLELGGVARAALDLTEGLAAANHEVTLVTHDAADCPQEWKEGIPGKPRVVEISSPTRGLRRIRSQDLRQVHELIESVDIVHLHTPWERSNLQLAKHARISGKPYVVTAHGMLDDWSMQQRTLKKKLYLALVGRRFLENASFVHCTALSEQEQSQKWFPAGKPEILTYFVSAMNPRCDEREAFQKFDVLNQPGFTLLFLSRVHYKKGIEHLITAIRPVVEAGHNINVLIAGPGEAPYVEQLKKLANSMGVADRVHFLGMVRGELKWSLMSACDLFVLPTSQENFGLVLIESMLCRTPVVTTPGVDIWHEIEEGGAVIVEQNPEVLAETINQLLSEPDDLKRRGEQSRDYVLDWLAPNTVLSRLEQLYVTAIEQCRAPLTNPS